MNTIILKEVKEKLEAGGYDGLYFPGECACTTDDLAPCGECQRDDDDEFINGCAPGHKHIDPQDPNFHVISASKEQPHESWEELRARYL